jgi:hypothetical protein
MKQTDDASQVVEERVRPVSFSGYLDRLLGTQDYHILHRESVKQLENGQERCRPAEEQKPTGHYQSRAWHFVTRPGPALSALHKDVRLASLLTTAVGRRLFPTRASYVHYPRGGFIGLHRDLDPCRYTVLTPLTSSAEPIYLHFDLAHLSGNELRKIAVATLGAPTGGTSLDLPPDSLAIISGSLIPHHRPPTSKPCTLAVLCFDSLV